MDGKRMVDLFGEYKGWRYGGALGPAGVRGYSMKNQNGVGIKDAEGLGGIGAEAGRAWMNIEPDYVSDRRCLEIEIRIKED